MLTYACVVEIKEDGSCARCLGSDAVIQLDGRRNVRQELLGLEDWWASYRKFHKVDHSALVAFRCENLSRKWRVLDMWFSPSHIVTTQLIQRVKNELEQP